MQGLCFYFIPFQFFDSLLYLENARRLFHLGQDETATLTDFLSRKQPNAQLKLARGWF